MGVLYLLPVLTVNLPKSTSRHTCYVVTSFFLKLLETNYYVILKL